MFKFYFNINFGDLPAWIQAITATVAAVLLLRTLRLQAQYTAAQIQITERDQNRFIKESEPIINFSFYRDELPDGYDMGYIKLTISKSPVYNLRFTSLSDTLLVKITPPSQPLSINIESPILLIYGLNQLEIDEPSPTERKITFNLSYTYEDKLGNHYKQRAWADLNRMFYHTIPEMVLPEKP